jgi:hypothetical protein
LLGRVENIKRGTKMRQYYLLLIPLFFLSCERGWEPPENPDPQQILHEAQGDFKEQRYKDALAKHIWFHDHALEYQPSMYGVRLSFALSYWKQLGDVYPPALKKMVKIRDHKTDRLGHGKGDRQLFHDVMALNRTLEQDSMTVDLFRKLDREQPELATQCWDIAKKGVIKGKAFDLVQKHMGSLTLEFEDIKEIYARNKGMYGGKGFGEDFQAYNENHFVEETTTLVWLAITLDNIEDAKVIQADALAILNDPRLNDVIPYNIYPDLNEHLPGLPSPFTSIDNTEYVISVTLEGKYTVTPVTLSNDRKICQQLLKEPVEFPALFKSGLHSEARLDQITAITGRSIEEITRLGRPGGLSYDGFLAQDETIISVIKGDNHIVSKLRLSHPQLARPLFHVLNMMDTDLSLNRWNMAKHQWENIQYFFYNKHKVFVKAEDTKGGQLSIFDDDIEGAFYINLWREFENNELAYLNEKYGHLSETEFNAMKILLSTINTGEMEPQYIMRYGFYEGHTFWRTDPISISFIFGIKSLQEIDTSFGGELYTVLTTHFVE